jgi:hypothetical protein
MLRHRLSRLLPVTTTLATFAGPAFAQDLSPIQTMLETVEAALTGARYPEVRLLLENSMLSDERIRNGSCLQPAEYHRTAQD